METTSPFPEKFIDPMQGWGLRFAAGEEPLLRNALARRHTQLFYSKPTPCTSVGTLLCRRVDTSGDTDELMSTYGSSTYGSNISFVDDEVSDIGRHTPRMVTQTPGLSDSNEPQLEDESLAAAISPQAALPPAPPLPAELSTSPDLPPVPAPPLTRSKSPNPASSPASTKPNAQLSNPMASAPKTSNAPVSKAFGKLGVTPKCTFCHKSVYAMERGEADGMVFHKTCFRCADCNRVIKSEDFLHRLDSA